MKYDSDVEDDDDFYDADSIIITQSQMEKIQKRNKLLGHTEEGNFERFLDFTNNLEDFIEDLEVKHALEKLKKRVEELTPRRRDRGRVLLQKGGRRGEKLQKAGETTLRPLTKEALDELERQIGEETSKRQDYDSRSVVSESSIVRHEIFGRSVHSAKSIAAIRKTNRCKEEQAETSRHT